VPVMAEREGQWMGRWGGGEGARTQHFGDGDADADG